jgi:hypothetical protein
MLLKTLKLKNDNRRKGECGRAASTTAQQMKVRFIAKQKTTTAACHHTDTGAKMQDHINHIYEI